MENEIVERYLSVKLTEQEWKERADELASVNIELDKLDETKKRTNEEFKVSEKGLKTRREALSHGVHTRTESRLIKCEWSKDRERKMAYLARTDSGEIIEQRELTVRELQEELF